MGCVPKLPKAGEYRVRQRCQPSDSRQTKIDGLMGSDATLEVDMKTSTSTQAKKHADCETSGDELLYVIGFVQAITIFEMEWKGTASMMHLQRAGHVVEALNVVVLSSSTSSADAFKLFWPVADV